MTCLATANVPDDLLCGNVTVVRAVPAEDVKYSHDLVCGIVTAVRVFSHAYGLSGDS